MNGTTSLNLSKAGEFEARVVSMLNEAALCLMTSLGHRSGLFDTMADLPPSTSKEIAEAAGLQERYVREWLAAMAVGGFVEQDPVKGTYTLPPEHTAILTRASGSENAAVYSQYIPQLGSVEEDVLACFRNGGGVPYERFARFHELMAEDSGLSVLPALREWILPLVPGLIGQLETGIDVLDAGCGRGKALNLMAEWFPNSRFTGYELSEEAVAFARAEAEAAGHTNVTFEARDLTFFAEEAPRERFDFVTTFDAVHDQGSPLGLLRGIRRALKPGGAYLAQDIKGSSHVHLNRDHLFGPLLYTVSCMHCMPVSLAQGGEGLGTMWGREKAEDYFRKAGFRRIEVHELDHDPMNYYYVCRP